MGATILFVIAAVFCLLPALCYLHQRFFAINIERGDALGNLGWRKRSWGVKLGPPHFGVCCKLMQNYQGRSFPKETAPPLPLPGCAMARCRCRYRFLRERRKGGERRRQMGTEVRRVDRRSGHDRRRHTPQ